MRIDIPIPVVSGTNTYTVSFNPTLVSYVTNQIYYVKFTNTNTGPSTINVNGLGPKSIKKNGNLDVLANDISSNLISILTYDGTNFQLLTQTALTGNTLTYLSGTGSTSQVPFYSNINVLTGSTSFVWDDTNKRLGIGTTTPIGSIEVVGTTSPQEYYVSRYSSDNVTGGFIGRKARGTSVSPSAILSGDTIAVFGGRGYGATGFSSTNKANVSFLASENWSDTNQGTYISFNSTTVGSLTRTEVGRLDNTGFVLNGQKLILGGNFTTSGAFSTTIISTNTTSVTLPTGGTLYGTLTGSITSAQLLTSLTDETGTGNIVFNTSPTFATSVIGSASMGVFNTASTTINAFGDATTMNIGGTSTGAVTYSFGANATSNATTKTINIGTAGVSGSTTNINLGSSVAGALGTLNLNTNVTFATSKTLTFNNTTLTVGSDASGDIWYRASTGIFTRLPIGTTGQALIVSGSGLPSWNNITVLTYTGTTWNGSVIAPNFGGTGVANATGSTITLGGAFVISGAFSTTITVTNTTSVTLPTTGTLATLAGTETLTNKTLTTPNIATIKGTLTTNVDGATITFNKNTSDFHNVILAGNRTLALSNMATGDRIVIRLTQDATGSRTVTWFTTIKWAGGVAPTLTTTANKADVFGFLCTGTNAYDGFVIGQNI